MNLALLLSLHATAASPAETPTWQSATAVVESTLDVAPQIQPISTSGAARETPRHRLRPRAPAPPAPAALGAPMSTASARGSSGATFAGIGQTAWRPPDPTLAVGPDHVVETVNSAIAFYSKSGTLQFLSPLDDTGSPGFFETVGAGDRVFDPKCLYDQHSGRFVVVALEKYAATSESYIDLAVSDDADPNGTWHKYRTWSTTDVGGTDYWTDYPGFGVDASAIYVTSNLFTFDNTGFGGVKYRIFDKAPLLSGSPASFADLWSGSTGSVQAAHVFGSPLTPFFISTDYVSSTSLRIEAITNPLTAPALAAYDVAVPAFGYVTTDVPNLGGSPIDALDGRIMNCVWRDGSLWAAHGVEVSGPRVVARWYEFTTHNWPVSGANPQLQQVGEVDAGPGVSTFFPAILPGMGGKAGLVMARSSASEYAGIACTGRVGSDPFGVMSQPLATTATGTAGYDCFRWGDYFGIALDPSDPGSFWTVGQYAVGSCTWQTWIASFQLCPSSAWVDCSYYGLELGSLASPFDTLAEGVTAVCDGGTVILKPSTCAASPVTLTRPMTVTASFGTASIE